MPKTFIPSDNQLRLLDFMVADPNLTRVNRLCQASGVSRATYYRWCQDPAFRQWFALAWTSQVVVDGALLVNVARNKCGEFPFWKALFDLIFDPKGLGLLHKWQQNAAQAAPPLPQSTPQPGPTVSPSPDENNPLNPQSRDSFCPASAPPLRQRFLQHRTPSAPASVPTLAELSGALHQLVPALRALRT